MFGILTILVVPFFLASIPSSRGNLLFESPNLKDDIYEQPVNLMNKKSPHDKDEPSDVRGETNADPWTPFDFSKFDNYLNNFKDGDKQDPSPELNRIKRRARRRRGRGGRRRGRQRATTSPPDEEPKNGTSTEVPVARAGEMIDRKRSYGRSPNFDMYQPPGKDWEAGYVEMPKDLYQAHLRPGVIFRIHMSEAILKMQYRNYGEDKDESVIEADVEYLRLTRKVINDEITKFEDLQWLIGWFHNRSSLIQEHMCNTRYYTVGTPPTMFTHPEEYMKRLCLFDSVYIDHIPYVVGEDSSLMAAVAPPVLHCDAATCTSVPFIDSVMFDERLPRTNVRTLTRCQASCRAHCRNDPDCLKRCSDRCLRSD
ncbi:uncharacterized protein LOC118278414 isoform X2 [Spodoptera frugiperda]|uniref:Uncharacterized protein LOC118278414 isoform X2 n=1 Tax=Spodoptera frugiperda TaxID=7108 RepID=A0A9R0E6K4_SPOFR|nr:uncharacterized protein LOC118278414 isoform X2 [Spodoptera frugiperda]